VSAGWERDCQPGGLCDICNDNSLDSWLEEEGIKDEVDDLATQMIAADERIRQLTAAAADCARATVVALDRLIAAEKLCREAVRHSEGLITDGALADAAEEWEKGRPS
jgi:hypothetical protein